MRSGIVQPNVYTWKDPDPVFVYGEAVVTQGLEVRDMTNGYGAVSRGLLWELYDIWIDSQYYDGRSTTWTAAAGSSIITNWTDANPVITTTWTPVQYGIWGEYTP